MKQLIFFTESFPYGKSESFIENEIGFLSQKFDRIYILPKNSKTDARRPLPDNCIVFRPVFRTSSELLLKGIFCLSPVFYFFKNLFTDKAYTSLYKLKKYVATAITCRCILADKNFKFLNRQARESTVYFYWGIGLAYVLPFIQNKNKKIVRFHRTDLYLEFRPQKYMPFRKEVFQNLTKAVFISRQGLEYAQKNFGQYHFAACLSYLGTFDHGIADIDTSDSVIHVLSVSNVVPVKRVPLILKSLLQIKDYPIHWTHIGGGKDFNALKKLVQQLPENITVNLTGAIANEDVIHYYHSHPVDLFINVSSSEGLPVSIMEAISFGIPVIATNVGGTNEIVTPESGVLLQADFESEQLARQIIHVYKNKQLFHPRRVWEEKFNAEKNYPYFIDNILI